MNCVLLRIRDIEQVLGAWTRRWGLRRGEVVGRCRSGKE